MSRVRASDFKQSDYAIGRTYLQMDQWDGCTRDGHFLSPHGFVRVWLSRHPSWTVTVLTLIYDGRICERRWKRLFGDRTIARLAREFVEEVVSR